LPSINLLERIAKFIQGMKRASDDPVIDNKGDQNAKEGKQQDEPGFSKQGQVTGEKRPRNCPKNDNDGVTNQYTVKDRDTERPCAIAGEQAGNEAH
jgi:hypothetical protein